MEDLKVLEYVKILYVEDEPITRNQVHRFLKKRVGKVILAENGEDGIQKFLEYQPNVIITDLVMPDMNGIEMMRRIRRKGYKSPVIITSALSDSKTILETVDLKIEKYLVKPINPDALLESLKEIIIEEIEKDKNAVVICNELILTEEKKKEIELEIRNIYSKYLKQITGKGAKHIQAFIKGKEIEILSKENLTIIEENLLLSGNNFKTIEIIRKTVYEYTRQEIEKELGKLIDREVVLQNIEISPRQKYERILLHIK